MKTIKFKSFSSGSCGNCYFLGIFGEAGVCEAGVLIDAGCSLRRLKKELEREGLGTADFAGLLVTHDHNDHVRALGSFCKHLAKPVWAPPGLDLALGRHHVAGEHYGSCRHVLSSGWNELVPGRIRAQYFEVPHDASQTVGYAVLLDGHRFVMMTDIGRMVPQAMSFARQADTVVIESNYDLEMLRHGPYPKELQDRIRGGRGHLSNAECAEAVRDFLHPGLRNIFLCHLSEHNNTPALACRASAAVIEEACAGDGFREGRVPRLCPLPRTGPSPLFVL